MDDISGDCYSWEFDDSTAELRCGQLSGQIDVSHPELGLHRLALDAQPFEASLLCVRRCDEPTGDKTNRPWPVADAYVRGSDLVAAYQPSDDWPFSPQIYWGANVWDAGPDRLSSLSLLVSVQTHLLETWPHISVESQVKSDEVLLLQPGPGKEAAVHSLAPGEEVVLPSTTTGCVLQRLAGTPFSYAEIMPANDFRDAAVCSRAERICRTSWRLFADFLEKGVIWRARMQSLIVPSGNDVELTIAYCRAMDQRPLPLTT
jgi:hypothetical protein